MNDTSGEGTIEYVPGVYFKGVFMDGKRISGKMIIEADKLLNPFDLEPGIYEIPSVDNFDSTNQLTGCIKYEDYDGGQFEVRMEKGKKKGESIQLNQPILVELDREDCFEEIEVGP